MAEGTAAEDGGPAGGRWVDVAPDRLARWVASFAERHGAITAEPGRRAVSFRAADGAAAGCHPPFPPMPAPEGGTWPADPADLAALIAARNVTARRPGSAVTAPWRSATVAPHRVSRSGATSTQRPPPAAAPASPVSAATLAPPVASSATSRLHPVTLADFFQVGPANPGL